ncbi:MAG: hypothetical protein NVS4B6_28340 [Mycobacterium sp.]
MGDDNGSRQSHAYSVSDDSTSRTDGGLRSTVWSEKERRIWAANVKPLNDLVQRWRTDLAPLQIPWFDPDGGGINARVLILMESPAPRTVRPGGSGFCSEDNVDASNQLIAGILRATGISRSDCLKWNIVPWAVLDTDGHPRTPTSTEIDSTAVNLRQLLDAADKIDIVVTLGKAALSGFMRYTAQSAPCPLYRVLAVPHPSQRNGARREDAVRRMTNAFTSVAAHLAER